MEKAWKLSPLWKAEACCLSACGNRENPVPLNPKHFMRYIAISQAFIMVYFTVGHFWLGIEREKSLCEWKHDPELLDLKMGYFKKIASWKDMQFVMQNENTRLLFCQDTVYPFGSSISWSSAWILENPSCLTSAVLLRGKGNPDLR